MAVNMTTPRYVKTLCTSGHICSPPLPSLIPVQTAGSISQRHREHHEKYLIHGFGDQTSIDHRVMVGDLKK